MKKRKKLIKRIGAVLCSFVVVVSCFSCLTFCASVDEIFENDMRNLNSSLFRSQVDYNCYSESIDEFIYIKYFDSEFFVSFGYATTNYQSGAGYLGSTSSDAHFFMKVDGLWDCKGHGSYFTTYGIFRNVCDYMGIDVFGGYKLLSSNLPSNLLIYTTCDFQYKFDDMNQYQYYFGYTGWSSNYNDVLYGKYNSSFGYLQNVRVENQYLRGEVSIGGVDLPLYYDDALDTLKRVWKFDTVSTSGIDLTSGYSVRHYIKEATVTGYAKEDIVEMSDMYLMDVYDASSGRLEYMQKDYDVKLEELGFEGLGFIDKYLGGKFLLEHHYFQIVNTATNECGGYLHVFPQNKDGDFSFEFFGNEGVELGFEGLDENLNVDIDAPSGEVGESVGHGDTYEEAEQQAQETQLRIEGMEQFVLSVESYASQVGNVSKGVGAFLGSLPSWVLGLFGLGVAITFVVIVIKGIRG